MEQVPQIYLDELAKAHGNMSATMHVFNAVEQGQYIPMETLLDSVRSMSTDLSKQAPNAYIFGSGLINPLGEENYQKYTEMLVKNGNDYVTIGDTQASQFLDKNKAFIERLEDAIEATGSTLEPNDILQGYTRPDGTRAPGLWDDISRGYAENAKGNIITVTPHAKPDRIWLQTELPALMNNPYVDAINGLPKAVFVDEFNALRASGLPMDKAYTKLNDTLVRGSSIEYMKRFAAPHFGSDLGKAAGHDYTKAANPDMADHFKTAKPETSLFRSLFETNSSDMTLPDDLKSSVNPSTFVKSNIIIGAGVGGTVFVGALAFGNSPAQAADMAVEVVEPAYWDAGMLASQGKYDLALDEAVYVTPEVIGCAIGGVIASPGIVTSAAGCAVGGYMAHETLGLPVNDWFEQRHHERVMEQMAVLGAQQAEGVEINPEILALQEQMRADERMETDPDFIRLSAGFGHMRLGLDEDGYYSNDVRVVLADPNTNPDAIDFAMQRYPGMIEGVLSENNPAQIMQEGTFTATVNTNDTIQYQGMKL